MLNLHAFKLAILSSELMDLLAQTVFFIDGSITDISTEVMESVKLMQLQYGNIIHTVADPRDVAIEGILYTIRNTTSPITFQKAANTVCKENEHVRSYLIGANNRMAIEHNKRFRDLRDRFLDVAGLPGSKVVVTSNKPLTLAWSATKTMMTIPQGESTTDLSDLSDQEKNRNNRDPSPETENENKITRDQIIDAEFVIGRDGDGPDQHNILLMYEMKDGRKEGKEGVRDPTCFTQ